MIVLKILVILFALLFLTYFVKIILNSQRLRFLKNVPLNQNNFIWPKISIISPVLNEAESIEKASRSMFEIDYPNVEFIFINDRSTDGTTEILNRLVNYEPRMQLIHNKVLPEGWIGKVHALNLGLKKATGEWILFADADVNYHKHSLKKAILHSHQNQLDFLTVLNEIICPSKIARILLAYFIHQFLIFENIKKIQSPDPFHFVGQGAFILFKKCAYEKTKGLEWLKQEVIEDMGFAMMMKQSGAKMDVLSGIDEIQIEWYSGILQIIKGFEKNIFASFQYSAAYVAIYAIFIFLFMFSYLVAPFLIHEFIFYCTIWISLGLYLFTAVFAVQKQVRIPFYAIGIFIFAPLFYLLVVLNSTITCIKNKGVTWRGVFYPTESLKKHQRFKFINLIIGKKEMVKEHHVSK